MNLKLHHHCTVQWCNWVIRNDIHKSTSLLVGAERHLLANESSWRGAVLNSRDAKLAKAGLPETDESQSSKLFRIIRD